MESERHDYAAAVTRLLTVARSCTTTQLEETAEVKQLVNEARQALQVIIYCAESSAAVRAMVRAIAEAEPTQPNASPRALLESSEPIEVER